MGPARRGAGRCAGTSATDTSCRPAARPALSGDEILARFVARNAEGPGEVRVLDLHDMTQPFASGSSLAPAAVVAPCSMSTLAAIAHGVGGNLIHRCADVMLKERRRLVIVPRETPMRLPQLRNLVLTSSPVR